MRYQSVVTGIVVVSFFAGMMIFALSFLYGPLAETKTKPSPRVIQREGYYTDEDRTYTVKVEVENAGGPGNIKVYCEVWNTTKGFHELKDKTLYISKGEKKEVTFTFSEVPTSHVEYRVWVIGLEE